MNRVLEKNGFSRYKTVDTVTTWWRLDNFRKHTTMSFERLTEQFAFLQKAENLKNTLRSAHTSAGRRESSAEHTWRLCLMILTFEKELDGLDVAKLLKLAVVHDLAEAVYGDIPAVEQGASRDKEAEKKQAMDELLADLPPDVQTHFLDLWNEYEDVQTDEAKFLKGLDKLETILQHNQGLNEPDFDYEFNLSYGKQYMDAHPLLARMRSMLDQTTQERANQKEK